MAKKVKPSADTISLVMAYLGSKKSKKKRDTARRNGKKGGRPRLAISLD